MTHPESGVLAAIAELEAEEAAQPRRPWWTSYEEAAERGAVIDVSPPSPHVMEAEGMLPQSAAFADAVDTNYAGIGGMGWRESVRRMPVDTRPMQFDGNGHPVQPAARWWRLDPTSADIRELEPDYGEIRFYDSRRAVCRDEIRYRLRVTDTFWSGRHTVDVEPLRDPASGHAYARTMVDGILVWDVFLHIPPSIGTWVPHPLLEFGVGQPIQPPSGHYRAPFLMAFNVASTACSCICMYAAA